MKLKYYLRGVGLGIIVATLIMAVSAALHNNGLSDEEIIKRATKLGMVMAETENQTENELFPNTEQDTEVGIQSDSSNGTEGTEAEEDTETGDVAETQTEIPDGTLITFTIESGEYTRTVAEKLYEAGLVEDAEAFRVYVGEKGRGNKLIVGTFEIPMGATYDEILDIITFH